MGQAGNSAEVPKEILCVTRVLIKEIGCAMPVAIKGCVEMVQELTGEAKDARQKSEADMLTLAEHDEKVEELDLKVQLLPNDSQKVARLQAKVTAFDVHLTGMRVAVSR